MTNCKTFFGLDDDFFAGKTCINTASEISGQPRLWKDLGRMLLAKKEEMAGFMKRFGDLRGTRIVLTGAGSSAFIGEALASFAAKSSGIKCEAVHTTDIVSAPETVLFSDIPTLLISFGRSGNSPESTGAIQYVRRVVKNLAEVAIVCDGGSKLHNITAESEKNLCLVMPEGSNDKGFAMTGSVSCMLLAGFALLNYEKIDEIVNDINRLSDNVEKNGLYISEAALKLAKKSFDRAIYLGSGAYSGIAHEGSLKMMELTNGAVNACYNSAAGFRHGPKTVIKDSALSLHFISNDPFTAQYDTELLRELMREKAGNAVVAVCGDDKSDIKADETIKLPAGGYGFAADLCVGINALVFFQSLAMHKSIELGITTDNPSPGGQVSRVVKGVTVYPY
jgi:tagatose-6-phosphate ketose/aldose isomerase